MNDKTKRISIKTLRTTKALLVVFSFLLVFISVFSLKAQATDYTSSNFILRDPVITAAGGQSSSTSFQYTSATGQTAAGESTSSSFKVQSGSLYSYGDGTTITTTPTPSTTPSVSGGATPSGSKVIFSGKAYPNSQVMLLKDAQIAKTALADSDANFTIELGELSAVDYLFSIYAKDYTGKSSRLILFPLKLEFNKITTVSNILIPPTILKDKKEVKKGETIDIFGQSVPSANLEITIKKPTREFSVNTDSDSQGKYKYTLDTSVLDFGQYQASSKVSFEKVTSISTLLQFIISNETILEKLIITPSQGDLNGDLSVNLVDFSILIYWFDKPNVPAEVDLNGDGIADLVDFSIMAYYWTG